MMNRKQRRQAEKQHEREQTALRQQMERKTDKIFKKIVKDEGKKLAETFNLNEKGKGIDAWHISTDTVGAVACMYMGDINGDHTEYPAITATVAKPELMQSFLEQLDRSYGTLNLPLIEQRGEHRVYFGSNVKLVLSQTHGELWSVYLGADGLVDRFIETGSMAFMLSETGYASFWHEWEIRIREDTLAMWENMLSGFQGVFFHVMQNARKDSGFVPGYDILIPNENVLIQRKDS